MTLIQLFLVLRACADNLFSQHLRSKYEWMMALPERTHERANSDVPKSAEG